MGLGVRQGGEEVNRSRAVHPQASSSTRGQKPHRLWHQPGVKQCSRHVSVVQGISLYSSLAEWPPLFSFTDEETAEGKGTHLGRQVPRAEAGQWAVIPEHCVLPHHVTSPWFGPQSCFLGGLQPKSLCILF